MDKLMLSPTLFAILNPQYGEKLKKYNKLVVNWGWGLKREYSSAALGECSAWSSSENALHRLSLRDEITSGWNLPRPGGGEPVTPERASLKQ